MNRNHRKFLLDLLLIWALALCILALQPKAVVLFFLRKAARFESAHIGAYMGLAYISAAYFSSFWPSWKRYRFPSTFLSLLGGFSIAAICAGGTELIQQFTFDRIPDFSDFKCDLLGAAYGLGIFFLYRLGCRWSGAQRFNRGRAFQLELFSEL